MAEWTVIIKNNSGSDFLVEDIGVDFQDGSTVNLDEEAGFAEIADSDDLKNALTAGTLVLNDGSADLSPADAVSYLSRIHRKFLEDNYFNKVELGTPGSATIDYENIANAPTFEYAFWYDNVKFRVEGIGLSTAPASPETGDVYVDDADHYQKYDGSAWQDLGLALSGDRVIDLSSGVQDIMEFDGSAWAIGEPDLKSNAAVTVTDDGDDRAARYVYNKTEGEWKKDYDVDFDPHLKRGDHAIKHDADQVEVANAYSNIGSGANDDVETVLAAIDTKIGTIEGGNLSDINIQNGIVYGRDVTRNKWMGPREDFIFSRSGNTKRTYLMIGNVPSNQGGVRLQRNMTITGISAQLDASGSCTVEVRKNDGVTPIATLSINSAEGAHSNAVNIDVSEGDFLQVYVDGSSAVKSPTVKVTAAYNGGSL
ncbi:MAG: hypothetical protein KJ737_25950 [Proteobacteria bacterium]|nr:hypothetical protein [Pseudomonadota bacterium]